VSVPVLAASTLSYPSLDGSTNGLSVQLTHGTTSREDVNRPLATAVTGVGNSAYFSVLAKVVSVTGTGDYSFHLVGDNTLTGAGARFEGRVYFRAGTVAGTYNVGVQASGGSATPSYSTDLPVGSTVLLVVKLTMNSPAADTASLWVNPATGLGSEPAADFSATGDVTSLINPAIGITHVGMRQGTNGTLDLEADSIRVGTTWASVTPASAVVAAASNWSAYD